MHDNEANLVKMANQIATFFESQTPTEPAKSAQALAGHIKLFWAPSMRTRLVDKVQRGDVEGISPIVVTAVHNHSKTLTQTNVHVAAEETLLGPEGGGDAG